MDDLDYHYLKIYIKTNYFMCHAVLTKNNQLPLLSLRSGSVEPPFWPGKVLDYWLYL